ncbi:MAG: DegT/DnrJ/EryC1/StrS family aminotransferase [bacterium]
MSSMSINRRVYLDNPNIGELEKKYVLDALESGFISTRGPLIRVFEEELGRYLGGFVAATYSGTAALHLSLLYKKKKLSIQDGAGVIVPSLTFAATANAVIYSNLIPIFVDVDLQTWNIDISKISDTIKLCKSRGIEIRFIMPVHLYGNPVDLEPLLSLCREHNLVLIEDSAESLGSYYNGLKCGTIGDLGVFSFNANKIITASSGGAIFSKSQEEIEYLRFLTLQARNESKGYYHEDLGFNYRMTNIEAAIALAQLQKLNYFLKIRQTFWEIYNHYLSNYVIFQKILPNAVSNHWLISCIIPNKDIQSIQQKLEHKGIPTRRIFYPLPLMDFYKQYVVKYLPENQIQDFYANSMYIYQNGICLPSSTKNTSQEIEYVCRCLLEIII